MLMRLALWSDRKANALVETAILVPTLLLICCGVADLARVIYAGIEIANAARAGVQYGALTPGNAGGTTGMVQAATADAADLSGVTATARNFCGCDSSSGEVDCSSSTCGGATPSGYVSVTANYTFHTILNWPIIPNAVALSRTAVMRVQ